MSSAVLGSARHDDAEPMSLSQIGDIALDRVAETDGLGFSPRGLFADFDEETFRRHLPWMADGTTIRRRVD